MSYPNPINPKKNKKFNRCVETLSVSYTLCNPNRVMIFHSSKNSSVLDVHITPYGFFLFDRCVKLIKQFSLIHHTPYTTPTMW